MTLRLALTAATTAFVLVSTPGVRAGEEVIGRLADAFVSADEESGRWTIGNRNIRFIVDIDRSNSLALEGLFLADGTPVTLGHDPDALITLDGRTTGLGARGSSLLVDRVTTSSGPSYLELLIHLRPAQGPLAVVRHYVVYPEAPVIELWTDFATHPSQAFKTENINAFELTIRAGAIRWLNGLDMNDEEGGPFLDRGRELGTGGILDLGSETVSSSTTVPYFSVEDDGIRFFAGLAWSGTWSAHFERV